MVRSNSLPGNTQFVCGGAKPNRSPKSHTFCFIHFLLVKSRSTLNDKYNVPGTTYPLVTCFSRLLGFTAWWHGGGWEGASQWRSQSCPQRRIFLHNQDGQVTSIHRGPTWLSPQNWQGLHIVWFLISPLGLHLYPAHLPPAQEISSLPANL